MTTRAEIVAEARSWIGTRWHHQAATKGVGVDCIGLLRGVGINTGLIPENWQAIPGVAQFIGYGRLPYNGELERGVAMFSQVIDEAQAGPGDFVLMRYGELPQHMAILGDYPGGGLSLIHAYAPTRKVVESRLDDQLRSRIVGWYRYPGVEL
jgi:NlpC/P60 family putative phage cell wall peptidase